MVGGDPGYATSTAMKLCTADVVGCRGRRTGTGKGAGAGAGAGAGVGAGNATATTGRVAVGCRSDGKQRGSYRNQCGPRGPYHDKDEQDGVAGGETGQKSTFAPITFPFFAVDHFAQK